MSAWDRGRWAMALVFSYSAGAGCAPRALNSASVDSMDAGTDRATSPTSSDASDASDGPCGVIQAPPGTFIALSAGNGFTCGIRTDGTLACWGYAFPSNPVFTGTYRDVSAHGGICAVRATGELECGVQGVNVGAPPEGIYAQVISAEDAGCARSAAGQVTCWGQTGYAPAEYQFRSLTGGAYYMCGIESGQGAAVCWEPRLGTQSLVVTPGPFAAVDTGRFFACGLRLDRSVSCWTLSPSVPTPTILGQVPPAGAFQELSTGELHACVLGAGGEPTCWGEDWDGDTRPPTGLLLAHVSAGSQHTCGIRPDGTVACWGGGAICGR